MEGYRRTKGYVDGPVGDVLYGDGLDDALADGDVAKVGGGAAAVRDDHQLRLHGGAVNLQVQGVVDAENNGDGHGVVSSSDTRLLATA